MTTVTETRLEYRDIKPNIGAEILANKEALLSGIYASEIRELLEGKGVLVFPQVHFTDDEQVTFTKTLGKFASEVDSGDIYKVTLDKSQNSTAEYLKGAFFWHFDGFSNREPIKASILNCKVTAPTGGNTEFANTYAAYDALPDERKQQIENLRASHSVAATQLYVDPEPSYKNFTEGLKRGGSVLPLVWKHESGRKSLLIGNSALNILDMDPLEGLEILVYLRDWATQERFHYSHEWTVGDTVMWDNTGSLHRAMPYPLDSGRLLHRTKLEGEEPVM